jgi:2-amino-4-hydroxy-6-hydroxymethyldihydropteridine diphosphokinase
MRTAVALGSNLGDRLANLRAAHQAIVNLPNVKAPVLASGIYETDPVSCEPGAGKFLNAVIEFDYGGEPLDLLNELHQIESGLGRPSNHPRNLSRKIDIDILYIDDTNIDTAALRLPHPRMNEREFVLRPLADIRPDLILPGQTGNVRDLLAQISGAEKAMRIKPLLETR